MTKNLPVKVGSHRDLGTVVEAARRLTFRTLVHLIGGKCNRA